MKRPKIITLDIETSPMTAYVWSLFKVNIGLNQIVEDWTILSYSAKTLGDPDVRYNDVSARKNPRNDSVLLKQIWKELDDADIVVTQNGIRFDHRKINARFIQLGLPMPSPFKMIDTKVQASSIAMFTSNRLEYLAKIAGSHKDGHRKFVGQDLWTACLAKDPEAWAEMRAYNIQDTIATEQLYLRLRPYMQQHPNVNVYDDDSTVRCPACGSSELTKRGKRVTNTGVYTRLRCDGCGTWSHTRYTENTLAKRKSLLGS